MIAISNGDRVVFPAAGITKGDVVRYYYQIAPVILPHVRERPLTLQRFPRGIGAKGFLQKNAGKHFPESIGRIVMPKRDGVTRHPAVTDADGLAYLANQGTLAFHIPGSRAAALKTPDRLVFDLDPPADSGALVREAALLVRALLADLSMTTLPMTSGSKGYHLVAAIEPVVEFRTISEAARKFAALAARRHPEKLSDAFRIAKREGRVYVDWLRNSFAATAIAPWSLRGLPGAPVAMPMRWEELEDSQPQKWSLRTAAARMADDPFATQLAEPTDPQPFVDAVNAMADDEGIVLEPFDRFRS